MTLDFISSGSAIYEPFVTPGQGVFPALIDGTTLYEPAVKLDQSVDIGFISSGSDLYEPIMQWNQDVGINFISAGTAMYEPTLSIGGWTEISKSSTAWSVLN